MQKSLKSQNRVLEISWKISMHKTKDEKKYIALNVEFAQIREEDTRLVYVRHLR